VATLERPTPATPTGWRIHCSTCGNGPWRRTFWKAWEERYGHVDLARCDGQVNLEGHHDTWFGKGAKKRG